MAAVKDYYKILGVGEDASTSAIKKAYRDLARKFHPDRNPGDTTAEERFKEIQEANDILSDPQKRKEYDQRRKNPFGSGGGFATGAGSRFYETPDGAFVRFETSDDGDGGDPFGGFSDLFGRVFNGGRAASRGRDINTVISLSFEEALEGGRHEVVLPSGEHVRINVPRGVHDGFRIRLRGRGQTGPTGRGDLYVTFRVEASARFERRGSDVHVVETIDAFEAILGTTREVQNAYGSKIKLTIPPGTQPGEKLRVRDQGVETKDGKGDMYVEVRVTVPKDLSAAQKRKLKELMNE